MKLTFQDFKDMETFKFYVAAEKVESKDDLVALQTEVREYYIGRYGRGGCNVLTEDLDIWAEEQSKLSSLNHAVESFEKRVADKIKGQEMMALMDEMIPLAETLLNSLQKDVKHG